jgi:hypothetical protein
MIMTTTKNVNLRYRHAKTVGERTKNQPADLMNQMDISR